MTKTKHYQYTWNTNQTQTFLFACLCAPRQMKKREIFSLILNSLKVFYILTQSHAHTHRIYFIFYYFFCFNQLCYTYYWAFWKLDSDSIYWIHYKYYANVCVGLNGVHVGRIYDRSSIIRHVFAQNMSNKKWK